MDDRHSNQSDDGEGEALAKVNSQLGKIVSEIWGLRWGLRFGLLLPAFIAAAFLYSGITTSRRLAASRVDPLGVVRVGL